MNDSDKKRQLQEIIQYLEKQIEIGLTYLYCAKSLYNALQNNKIFEKSRFYKGTFLATAEGAFLAYSRLVDKNKDSITIHYLFNVAENNPELFSEDNPEEIKQAVYNQKSQLEKYKELTEDTKQMRDKLLAHLDKILVNDPPKFKYLDLSFTIVSANFRNAPYTVFLKQNRFICPDIARHI